MVQVINTPGNYSSQLAKALGGGLGEGLNQASQLALQLAVEKAKKGDLFGDIAKLREKQNTSNEDTEPMFRNIMSSRPQEEGEFTERGAQQNEMRDADTLWSSLNKPQIQGSSLLPSSNGQNEDILSGINEEGKLALAQKYPEAMKYLQKEEERKETKSYRERKLGLEERKETRPMEQSIQEAYENAENTDNFIARMRELDKEGISPPLAASVVEYFGLPIGFLNKQGEELDKISATMATQVGKVYGFGNIRAIEFQNFLRSLPSLMNTKEGREQIYRVMEYKTGLDKERYRLFNDIIDENGGKTPPNIEGLIIKRMQPAYKKFGKVLKYGYEPIRVRRKSDKKSGIIPRDQLDEAIKSGEYEYVGEKD